MKVKKIKINGYDVFIYNTKKYSSINMRFLFEMDYTKDNIFKSDLMEEYAIYCSSKYKTRKEINERRMELYSMNFGMNNYNKGEKMFTEAIFNFVDPELIKDDYLKEALEFGSEMLLNPNFDDGKLDKVELSRSIDNLVSRMGDNLMDFHHRVKEKFINSLFPNSYKTIDMVDSIEEYESILKSYTYKDIIDIHDRLIKKSVVGLVIMGNIKDEYLSYIEELFKFDEVRELDTEYKEMLEFDKNLPDIIHEVDKDYRESVVRGVYRYDAKNLKETLICGTIAKMIGSSGMLMHKTLRDELGIVYSAGVKFSKAQKYIVLVANIDSDNFDKTVEGFDMVMKKLEDEALVEELLNKIKESRELYQYTFDENKWNPFYELYDTSFGFDVPSKKKTKIICSLTSKDILKVLKRIKRDVIFYYEGVKK